MVKILQYNTGQMVLTIPKSIRILFGLEAGMEFNFKYDKEKDLFYLIPVKEKEDDNDGKSEFKEQPEGQSILQ